MANENIEITAYLKTFCGWSEGVRAVFRKYELDFVEKDIIKNPAFRWDRACGARERRGRCRGMARRKRAPREERRRSGRTDRLRL